MRAFDLMVAGVATAVIAGSATAAFDLRITEIYEGVSGDDITTDWAEITNLGDTAFTFGVDSNLWYDDESSNPADGGQLTGFTDIQPGESVILVLSIDSNDVTTFFNTWDVAGSLTGVEIGYLTGNDPGLSQGGDQVNLFDAGTIPPANLVDSASYIGVNNFGAAGSTWTWDPNSGWTGAYFSRDGVQGAYSANVAAGDFGELPLIGSPGVLPTPGAAALLAVAGIAGIRRRR